MNTNEKTILYLGCAVLVFTALARIMHYIEPKEMGSVIMFGMVVIVNAYKQYAKRLQRRNAELEQQLQLSIPAGTASLHG